LTRLEISSTSYLGDRGQEGKTKTKGTAVERGTMA